MKIKLALAAAALAPAAALLPLRLGRIPARPTPGPAPGLVLPLPAPGRTLRLSVLQHRARQRAGPAAGGALVVHFPDAAGMESAAARHQEDAADEAADAEEHEQQLQRLEATLAELPPDQRQCLELFYLEKKSYREVAALTGLDLKAVKSHLQNGKRNLRRHLQAAPDASP